MIDLIKIYNNAFEEGYSIALLPSQGIFSIKGCFTQEDVIFSHCNSISGLSCILDQVHLISLEGISENQLNKYSQKDVCTALTGITKEDFLKADLAIIKFKSEEYSDSKNHNDDLILLKSLSKKAFHALDVIRFINCDLVVSDKLPHIPGYWNNSNGYIGGIILSKVENRIIAGRQMGGEIIFGLGLGLEETNNSFEAMEYHPYWTSLNSDNEVGKMVRHSMKMFSRAMYLNNDTLKFIISVAIFEYLGSGDKFEKFQDIRKKLQPHLAKNMTEYNKLTDFFQLLTGKKINGINVGYRTKIIHEGAFLEDILPDIDVREKLFYDLSTYIKTIILEMYSHTDKTLDDLQLIRRDIFEKIKTV